MGVKNVERQQQELVIAGDDSTLVSFFTGGHRAYFKITSKKRESQIVGNVLQLRGPVYQHQLSQ